MTITQKAFSMSSNIPTSPFTKKVFVNKKFHLFFIRSYIPSYINFCSWFLIVPYNITWDQLSGKFITTSSKTRKILCCIANIFGLLSTTPYLIGVFYHLYNAWTQPTYTLTSITNFLSYIAPFEFIRILTKKTEIILDILNWHLDKDIVHHVPVYKIGFICIVPLVLIALYNPITDIVDELIWATYLEQPVHNVTSTNLFTDNGLFRWVYFGFYVASQYGHLYYLTSTGFLLALILTTKESISQITKRAYFNNFRAEDALLKGVKMETEIRNLMNMSNSIIGNRVLLEYFMMLSFYVTILEFFSGNSSKSLRIHVLLYLIFSGVFWMCACEVQCLVRNYIKQWVNSYQSTYLLESHESLKSYPLCLLAIQSEADLNPVAVSCRCFNVTYGFLGSMLGLIITYSTIVYQMKFDKQCKN